MIHKLNYQILHQPQIKQQLSGNQVESLLNYFLIRMIEPISQTLWFKNEIIAIINNGLRDQKVRISSKDQKESIINLLNFLISYDKEEALTELKQASLDRGLLQDIIIKFLELGKFAVNEEIAFYKALTANQYNMESANRLSLLEDYFQGLSPSYIIRLYYKVHYWFKRFLDLKQVIASKYYLFAYKQAKILKYNKPYIDEDCLFKSLLISIDTAIDRYTCKKGTLTSYIQMWFKSAITNPKFDYELGKAFQVPVYGRKKLKDNPILLPAVSTDSDDFVSMEGFLTKDVDIQQSTLFDFENIDYELLDFINNINDNNVDLVKIVLNIPQFA